MKKKVAHVRRCVVSAPAKQCGTCLLARPWSVCATVTQIGSVWMGVGPQGAAPQHDC